MIGGDGCCGFFGLFGPVLKVVLPNVSPVSVAGVFRGQHSVLWYNLFAQETVLLHCSLFIASTITFSGCCGFFGLLGHDLKVVPPNASPVSVADIFRGQHSVLWCSLFGSWVFMAVRSAFVLFRRWVIMVISVFLLWMYCCDKEERLSVPVIDGCP